MLIVALPLLLARVSFVDRVALYVSLMTDIEGRTRRVSFVIRGEAIPHLSVTTSVRVWLSHYLHSVVIL